MIPSWLALLFGHSWYVILGSLYIGSWVGSLTVWPLTCYQKTWQAVCCRDVNREYICYATVCLTWGCKAKGTSCMHNMFYTLRGNTLFIMHMLHFQFTLTSYTYMLHIVYIGCTYSLYTYYMYDIRVLYTCCMICACMLSRCCLDITYTLPRRCLNVVYNLQSCCMERK